MQINAINNTNPQQMFSSHTKKKKRDINSDQTFKLSHGSAHDPKEADDPPQYL